MKVYSTSEIKELIRSGNKKKFYDSAYWRKVITPIIVSKFNNECAHCKVEGKLKTRQQYKLDINHIKPIEDFPELAYELSNLELICVPHHNIADNKYFKNKKKRVLNQERW